MSIAAFEKYAAGEDLTKEEEAEPVSTSSHVDLLQKTCDHVARLSGYALTQGESHYHRYRYNTAQLYRLTSFELDRAAVHLRKAMEFLRYAEK